MKVRLMDIFTRDICNIDRASDRIMHMSKDDAFCLAFILRRLIMNSSYEADELKLTTDGTFLIPEVTYKDICTLSKLMMRKPYKRDCFYVDKIADKIYSLEHDDTVTCQSHKKGEEESHEN